MIHIYHADRSLRLAFFFTTLLYSLLFFFLNLSVNSGCHQAVSVPDALVTSEVHDNGNFGMELC
jgi:hypothetical protein